jgi:hypothetical protein
VYQEALRLELIRKRKERLKKRMERKKRKKIIELTDMEEGPERDKKMRKYKKIIVQLEEGDEEMKVRKSIETKK